MIKIPAAFTGNMFITYLPAIPNGQSTEPLTTDQKNVRNSSTTLGASAELSNNNNNTMDAKGGFPNVNQLLEGTKNVTNSGSKLTKEKSLQLLASKDVKKKLSAPVSLDSSISQQNFKGRRKSKSDSSDYSSQINIHKHFGLEDVGHHSNEVNINNLDLSTLTSLYLESRRRIFGDEWAKRKSSVSVPSKDEVGSTGVSKPRKLSPLSVAPGRLVMQEQDNETAFHSTPISKEALTVHLPTPGGLHLSANFSHLNLESSLNSSKGSRRSFRRMNSMSEISRDKLMEDMGSPAPQHRPSSAPIHKKDQKARENSISSPDVTPARANTPTEPSKSARAVRPQLIGGSLATCSPDQIINAPQSSKFVEIDNENLQKSIFLSDSSRMPSARLKSSPELGASERPLRRSLPSRLSLNSQGSIMSDPVPPFLSSTQGLPPKSSRYRLVPLNNPNKKLSLP